MVKLKRILMAAAENDSLPGAKVGGVGDVMRDLPNALVNEGALVDTVIPSYGYLARLPGLIHEKNINVQFAGEEQQVEVLRLPQGRVDCYILHHPLFSKWGESPYFNDDDGRPFASDGIKFSFFSAGVVEALNEGAIPRPDLIHCHDWHTAYILILLRFNEKYANLNTIKTVFTVHNLAMQGVRPYNGDESSFNTWFPDLHYRKGELTDPRYPDCINPMRAGILLADVVNTVSPSYAREILQESHYHLGIYGGDGLEKDLRQRTDKNELFGILNGCEYPADFDNTPMSSEAFAELMLSSVESWALKSQYLSTAHWFAEKSIQQLANKIRNGRDVGFKVTTVGRLVEQKVRVLHTKILDGRTALEAILDIIGDRGTYIILGNGSSHLEAYFAEMAASHHNLIFLNGYSDHLSQELYKYGDLYLMPSSFEPCGISQMLAMRAKQPCLVNAVGGLRDTIRHMESGFVFCGDTAQEQAEALVTTFKKVMNIYLHEPERWRQVCETAGEQRFTWEDAADQYIELLYR